MSMMGWTRLALVAAAGMILCAGQVLAQDTDGGATWSGREWLLEAGPLEGAAAGGTLTQASAEELAVAGGALLVSGRALEGQCELAVQVGEVEARFELGAQPSVVHVPLGEEGGGEVRLAATRGWSVRAAKGKTCAVALEGAVLFVGEAAAYVGDDPQRYWASLRGERAGVR